MAGGDCPTLKAADEGMVEIIGETDVKSTIEFIDTANIDDLGSIWDTIGGKVEEANC